MELFKHSEIQVHHSTEHLIPVTGPTKNNPSWWIQQFTSNPIDPECGVIHNLTEKGV